MSGSSALKASSISRMSGETANARARPTRWRIPPESSSGRRVSQPRSPTSSSASAARARRSARGVPCISSPNSTFPRTVRCGNSAKCWKTIPKRLRRSASSSRRGREARSRPAISTRPAVGRCRPLRRRNRVDFPLPDRPMTTKTSPRRISRLRSSRASTHPCSRRRASRSAPARRRSSARSGRGPKTLDTDETWISGVSCTMRYSGRRSGTSAGGRPL